MSFNKFLTAMKPTSSFFRRSLIAIAATAFLAGAAHAASTTIDLGAADGYSAFIFGNVGNAGATGFHDVEGRLAAGGNVYLNSFSVNETDTGANTPSIVAGGNLNIGYGSIGNSNGTAVYGASNASATLNVQQWFPTGTFSKGSGSTPDFGAARQQLTSLSSTVSELKSNGAVVAQNSGYTLVGSQSADIDVFNINTSNLANLTLDLASVKSTATIIINDSASSINLSGDFSSLSGFAASTLFNFSSATSTSVTGAWVWGSILAPEATFSGTGHLQGTLVANAVTATSDGSTVEIGALGFKPVAVTTAVPEPESYAMLLAGIALLGVVVRRKAV
jgi:choice-of-anchor A domain-containing protein